MFRPLKLFFLSFWVFNYSTFFLFINPSTSSNPESSSSDSSDPFDDSSDSPVVDKIMVGDSLRAAEAA